jgi:hypothetical protein
VAAAGGDLGLIGLAGLVRSAAAVLAPAVISG